MRRSRCEGRVGSPCSSAVAASDERSPSSPAGPTSGITGRRQPPSRGNSTSFVRQRVDIAVVTDVIAKVRHGRRIEGRDPEGIYREAMFSAPEVVEVFDDPAEIPDAVAVRVGEAARVDLVEDGVPPVRTRLVSSITSSLSPFGRFPDGPAGTARLDAAHPWSPGTGIGCPTSPAVRRSDDWCEEERPTALPAFPRPRRDDRGPPARAVLSLEFRTPRPHDRVPGRPVPRLAWLPP